ncbi:MAG TPA: sugar transferase [Longimicrobiales bacterium]|nr:sugar transferase [Longimicrobiales bacterium]
MRAFTADELDGQPAAVSLHTVPAALPATPAADLPFPVPAAVLEARSSTPWDAFLPAHAGGWGWTLGRAVKRGLDIVLAVAGLVLLAPLFIVLALVVKLSSPGPIFYEWRVLGRHARPFRGWKFRTMVVNADELKGEILAHNEMTGPAFKMRNDPRVTRAGRWMRKYSLDELPQLWSVLKGDMSLVGPRPPGPHEFVHFADWQRGKLAVTPGITCIWQVSGRSEIRDFDEWMRLDLEYIRNWSLRLDLAILARTLPAVFRGRGAY